MTRTLILILFALTSGPARAEAPRVDRATAERAGMGWQIQITLSHPDTGWDHYADGWEVLDAEGHRLAYRELMHPHVAEQPFTRALFNVMVPDGTRQVFIRTHCSVAGWSKSLTTLTLRP